jgi:hypothetical protein
VAAEDHICPKSSTPLSRSNQQLETWIERAASHGGHYQSSDGDFGDAVKALLAANEMNSLLWLAQHPLIPLSDLSHIAYGNGWPFGFEEVAMIALDAYIIFNVLDATLFASKCKSLHSYSYVLRSVTSGAYFNAETVPFRAFFGTSPLNRWSETDATNPITADHAY